MTSDELSMRHLRISNLLAGTGGGTRDGGGGSCGGSCAADVAETP
jgi:hypothetical protein